MFMGIQLLPIMQKYADFSANNKHVNQPINILMRIPVQAEATSLERDKKRKTKVIKMEYIDKEREQKELVEVKTETKEIFDGSILHVYKDSVNLPNGEPAVRELIRHVGAVAVVPLTADGKVIIERQYRYPLDKVITEIPAGKLDSKAEDRLEAAKRELKEETGITAAKWTELGIYYPAAAYTDEKITMYLAEELDFGKQNLDEDEFLKIQAVPLEQLVEEIMAGSIGDGKTIAAILKVDRLRNCH